MKAYIYTITHNEKVTMIPTLLETTCMRIIQGLFNIWHMILAFNYFLLTYVQFFSVLLGASQMGVEFTSRKIQFEHSEGSHYQ